ncbi:MAG: hypothetical protein ABI361_03320 [Nitrososphaera sp.]|jgi:integrase
MPVIDLNRWLDTVAPFTGYSPSTVGNYGLAVRKLGISLIDTGAGLDYVWTRLHSMIESGTNPSLAELLVKCAKAACKAYGFEVTKSAEYKSLARLLRSKHRHINGYSAEEVTKLLRLVERTILSDNGSLWRLCALCVYSGLHISGAKDLRWASFTKEANGVYVFPARNNAGELYLAAIGESIYDQMQILMYRREFCVIQNDKESRSPWDRTFRHRLYAVLKRTYELEMLKGHSPFESLRKFYLSSIEISLGQHNIAMLSGAHVVSDTEQNRARIAELYSRTPFVQTNSSKA